MPENCVPLSGTQCALGLKPLEAPGTRMPRVSVPINCSFENVSLGFNTLWK